MDVESRQGSKGDAMAAAAAVSVDWRGRPCDPLKHGGMKAAVFVLGSCELDPSLSFSCHGSELWLNKCWFFIHLCSSLCLFFIIWSMNLHACMLAGIQAFEMMAIAAVGNNLITYVFGEMHFPLSEAANIVTNFIGTVFLLSLLGGFLSDSYLGSFCTMVIFGFVELSVILNTQFIINLIIITYLDASIIIIT